ncbi:phosphatase [Schlegelella sp. S2-27]|uniref:Phosphatase n=1 Tax=Caldimonas mangrovi TaxID=2944811 RepID=A0ABT0YQ28_9BURK|nr:phosphatase [Caldimonas mangrovi]MCM5680434.1 phosphatase [Caldimonas mangrovi]
MPERTGPAVLRGDRLLTDSSRFRTMSDLTQLRGAAINTEGLAELSLSGSASLYSNDQIEEIKRAAGGRRFVVLDLREESHAIVGGYPATWIAPDDWGCVGMKTPEVLAVENTQIENLRKLDQVTFVNYPDLKWDREPHSTTLHKPSVVDEKTLVESGGGEYRRLPITDHVRPSRERVDEFVDFVRNMEPDTWLHVHCKGGKGRTTSTMVMFDMLHNASRVSAEDILARQTAMGGSDLVTIGGNRIDMKQDRLAFLLEFHAYAKANPLGAENAKSWAEWRMAPKAVAPEATTQG